MIKLTNKGKYCGFHSLLSHKRQPIRHITDLVVTIGYRITSMVFELLNILVSRAGRLAGDMLRQP